MSNFVNCHIVFTAWRCISMLDHSCLGAPLAHVRCAVLAVSPISKTAFLPPCHLFPDPCDTSASQLTGIQQLQA